MSVTKAQAIAHVRLSAPDLGAMEEFLQAFGLKTAHRSPDRLYMRASDGQHHVHITELGPPRFVGFGFRMGSLSDLESLAALPGASAVESIDEPGGGSRVVLQEPNGYGIEAVFGVETRQPDPRPRQPMNTTAEPLRRVGELMRPEPGPACVSRIAHCVLATPRVGETVQWFRDTFGLIGSDDVYDDEDKLRMSFSRLDRGDVHVDHHALFCAYNPRAGLNHVSFEVEDLDDLFLGHEHLRSLGKYEHIWGIGRHFLGSNIFDYWADPWGRVHEHWSDTDRINAAYGTNRHSVSDGVMRGIWGEGAPDSFKGHVSP